MEFSNSVCTCPYTEPSPNICPNCGRMRVHINWEGLRMAEFGRACRFYWQPAEVKMYGDDASVTIGDFTHYKKKYVITLGILKEAIRNIEGTEAP